MIDHAPTQQQWDMPILDNPDRCTRLTAILLGSVPDAGVSHDPETFARTSSSLQEV